MTKIHGLGYTRGYDGKVCKRNLHTAGTAGIKACGDMSKDTCAAHEAHESLADG